MALFAAAKTEDIAQWNVHRVGEWLVACSLEQLVPPFKANDIDGEILMTLTEDDLKNTFGISSLGLRRRVMTRLSELLDMSRPRAKLMSQSSSIGYGFDPPVPPASALRTASEPPGVSLQTTTPAPAQSSQMQRPQRVPSPQKRGKLETDKLEQHAINVMDAKHEQKDVILKTTAVSEAVPDKPITFQHGERQG